MFEALASVRLWLTNLDPAAPAVALMLGVFLAVYSIRRWLPRVWIWVEATVPFVDSLDDGPALTILWKTWQAWPAAVLGAGASALANGGSPVAAIKGAALGLAVAAIHELAAAYKGRLGAPKPRSGSGGSAGGPLFGLIILTLVLACGLPGCSVFGPGGSVWPKLGVCAPTPAEVFSKVESILSAGNGDYEADLLALGRHEGLEIVECAVQAVVSGLTTRSRITSDESRAVARGAAFMAKREDEQ
jgi:hypothetical protein